MTAPWVIVKRGGGGGGGVTDHGALAGLGDDDHTQYLLVDGTRAMTGALNMGSQAITSVGNVDGRDVSADGTKLDGVESGADVTDAANVAAAGAFMLTGGTVSGAATFNGVTTFNSLAIFALSIISNATSPAEQLLNTTDSDADGARDSSIAFAGYRSGSGTAHTLAQLKSNHDGTGADDNGKFIIAVNDGNDGTSPTDVVTITGDDQLADFAGEVRHAAGRIYATAFGASQTIAANTTTAPLLLAASATHEDTGYTHSAANDDVEIADAGRYEFHYDITAEYSSGATRGTMVCLLQEATDGSGGTFASVSNTESRAYIRTSTDSGTCSMTWVLDVAAGSAYRISVQSIGPALAVQNNACRFTVKRVQGAS